MRNGPCLLAIVVAVCAASPVLAQPPKSDPLSCAKAVDGAAIRIGTTVRDASGAEIGSVSLSQCSAAPDETKLRVWLERRLGGEVKVFDLKGVTVGAEGVTLPLTEQEIAGMPTVQSAYAQGRRPTL